MRVPVYLPRFAEPCRGCECQRKQIDYAFKTAVLTWRLRQGDDVHKEDIVCEAEAEKTVIEISSPVDGRLAEICIKSGEQCGILTPIGYIETPE